EASPSNDTASGTVPEVGVTVADAVGAMFDPAEAGITNSVTLCAGTLVVNDVPEKLASERCAIAFADVSCHACATPRCAKFERLTVTGVDPESTLLTTMTVSAPSEARTAANAESVSGFGTEAEQLVSPKAERLPS